MQLANHILRDGAGLILLVARRVKAGLPQSRRENRPMGGSNQLRYATPRLVDAKTVHPRQKKKKKKEKAGTHLPKPARLGGRVGFLNVFSGLNQPETDDPCARGRETKHKEARESNIIWRELKHRRNTSLWAEQRGAIKLVTFAENSKHNKGQNKGQNFRVFQGSKWNYKLDYTLWVPLIIICIAP